MPQPPPLIPPHLQRFSDLFRAVWNNRATPPRTTSTLLVFLSITTIGILGHYLGEIRFTLLYFIPLYYAAWVLPLPTATLFTPLATLAWIAGNQLSINSSPNPTLFIIASILCKLLAFFIFTTICSIIHYLFTEQRRLYTELTQAQLEINELRDLIPICCNCRKIKDTQGNWQLIEEYLSKHQGKGCSHGYCNECAHSIIANEPEHQHTPTPTTQ